VENQDAFVCLECNIVQYGDAMSYYISHIQHLGRITHNEKIIMVLRGNN